MQQMQKKLLVIAVMTAMTTGCATVQEKTGMSKTTTGTVVGSAIGCAGGALATQMAGGSAWVGCLVGGAVGGFVGYEKARQEEIAEAEAAREEAVAAMNARIDAENAARAAKSASAKPMPKVVSSVKSKNVTVTDKATGEKKVVKALDEVVVEMPVSMRNTPEYTAAMGKLRTLAERMADQRGSAEITRSMTKQDAGIANVQQDRQVVTTAAGNKITVVRSIGAAQPGYERIVIRPGKLSTSV